MYRIPLQNIAGDEVLGIFSLVYPVYMVALYLSVAGIPLAISKLIAEANTRGETHKIHKIYRTASILALCFGILSFTLIFALSGFIANMLGGPTSQFALIVVGMTLLLAPYMAIYRGFFQGFGDMKPTAISQVIEQLVRATLIVVIAIVLVKLDYSNEIVAGGVMFGSIIGVIGSLVFLRMKYRKSPYKVVKAEAYTANNFKDYSGTILKISIPIAIGSVTMALFNFVDSFTIPAGLRAAGFATENINYMFGIYSRGLTLVQITTVFASSIILPLVPLITKKLVENDRSGTRAVIEQTQKMTHLISWPAAFGLLALTLPLNLALFTNTEGSLMLAIINFSSVFTSLTLLGTGILQGMNAVRLSAYIIVGGVLVKIAANLAFIPLFELEGAAYATLLVYLVIFVANTIFIYRKMKFTVITPAIMKMIGASAVMGAVIGIPTLMMDVANWSRLVALAYSIVAIGIGAVIYFILLWLTKAINHNDLRKLPVIGKKIQKKYPKAQDVETASTPAEATQQVVSQAAGSPPIPPTEKKERKKSMKKQLWLWALIVALIAATSPFLIDRWNAERNSDQYEIMLPFESIQLASNGSDYSVDEILTLFKEKGLTTVSLEPVTLEYLSRNNIITTDTEAELASLFRFTEYENQVDVNKHGYYISVPDDADYQRLIEEALAVEKVSFGNKDFYFLSDKSNYSLKSPLGFDLNALETINRHGLNHTFRIGNDSNLEVNRKLVNQLVKLKSDNTNGILPLGTSIIGAGSDERDHYIQALYEAGYFFYLVEFTEFKEFGAVGKVTDYNVIRLLSTNLTDDYILGLPIEERIERGARAIKERNVRSLYYNMPTVGNLNQHIDDAAQFIEGVTEKTPERFSVGEPSLFEKVNVPAWALGLLFIAGMLYVYVASEVLINKWMRFGVIAFMALLAVAYVLLNKIVFIQAFALIIAVVAPTYAVMKSARGGATTIGGMLSRYLQAAGITIVGILLVVSFLNGNMFYTKFEVFRGVILVYVLPIASVLLYQVFKQFNIRNDRDIAQGMKKLMNFEVKYWHLFILVVIAAVGYFYVGRTGNNGMSFSFELAFRNWLENTLYSRPRTKEFLIGFPLFVLGLYVLKTNKLFGRLLMVGGVIGFLSITNTFTHLHMPLDMSILRTIYGLAFGFIIGLFYIAIYKLILRLWAPLKKRWL